MYKQQVKKEHYSFERYFFPGRWMSYYYQTREFLKRDDIHTILDIGPGTSFMRDVLQIHRPQLSYKTLDIAPDINPDYLGEVLNIPLPDNSYDAVSAFQVLEHISFGDFEHALTEMKRVSSKYVFISLPHFGPSFELLIKCPFFPRMRFALKIPFPKRHVFQGQHYWEIGKKGYPARDIRRILKKHFIILDEYIPFENQYHHFYILLKR